jgi:O-antigen ligase
VDFVLFILVNATLFTRPTEIVPELQEFELYQYLILPCLLFAIPGVLHQLEARTLFRRPITFCVLGMLLAIPLSSAWNNDFGKAVEVGFDFFKVVIYYLILVAVVNTPARVRRFMGWVAVLSAATAVVSLLHYYEVIRLTDLKDLKEKTVSSGTGLEEQLVRLRGPGQLFGDPNDACAVFVVGLLACCYFLTERGLGAWRLAWLVPLGICGYAQALTYSRGGFLGLLVGLAVLFRTRFGWKKSILLYALVLPVLLFLAAARTADLSAANQGTGQDRIQVWGIGLQMLKSSPVFGIGKDQFSVVVGDTGLVAHNSFIHCFAELGLFGGMCFLGMFYLAFLSLYRIGKAEEGVVSPELKPMQPFLMAVLAAYAACLMSISRSYIVTTYTIIGLVAAYADVAETVPAEALRLPRIDGRLFPRLAGVSLAFLGGMEVFVRLFVRW